MDIQLKYIVASQWLSVIIIYRTEWKIRLEEIYVTSALKVANEFEMITEYWKYSRRTDYFEVNGLDFLSQLALGEIFELC